MIPRDSITFDNLDAIAAAAFASSREAATAIRQDVIPNVDPRERPRCEHLLSVIENRRIFRPDFPDEVEVVISTVSRRIMEGTRQVEQFIADECHIEGGVLHCCEERTEQADELARALPFLLELRELVLSIQDLLAAEKAIEEFRRRL